MICGHGHEQGDSKIIQIPYPRAKAIDQNAALCPVFPPAGLTLIAVLVSNGTVRLPLRVVSETKYIRSSSFDLIKIN